MKIDLSKLPADTYIDVPRLGRYVKGDPGVWHDAAPHCVDCSETIFEDGFEGDMEAFDNPVTQTTAETYFLDFTVVAIPPGFDLKDAQC